MTDSEGTADGGAASAAIGKMQQSPHFKTGVFIFALVLLALAWKFGLEGILKGD